MKFCTVNVKKRKTTCYKSLHALVDGGWGEVKNDTDCSKSCGVGSQRQSKFCINPTPDHGGANCSCGSEHYCDGKKAEIIVGCNLGLCPPGNLECQPWFSKSFFLIF